MADLNSIGKHCQTSGKNKNTRFTKSKTELKSSIPKPTLFPIRAAGGETLSISSGLSQTSVPSRLQSADHSKSRSGTVQHKKRDLTPHPPTSRPRQEVRPQSASSASKNPYAHVKSKIDNKLSPQTKLTCQRGERTLQTDKSHATNSTKASVTSEKPSSDKPLTTGEVLEKQRQLLSIYMELQKVQPSKDLQPLEQEIFSMMQSKTLGHLEGLTRNGSFILDKDAPEFLAMFDKQMQAVKELWLRLLCDVSSKVSDAPLSLPESSMQDLREEIYKFLSQLSVGGDQLHTKLEKIEEETLTAMARMIPIVLALSRESEELRDKYSRLERTQDDINTELKEELEILNSENRELHKKYSTAAQQLDLEKKRTEQQEKQKIIVQKDLSDTKRLLKIMETKCTDLENRSKKADSACKTLEVTVRNTNAQLEKEKKQRKELMNKASENEHMNKDIQAELAESNQARIDLEFTNKTLQRELTSTKATLEESLLKQTELMEEFEKYKRQSIIEPLLGGSCNTGTKNIAISKYHENIQSLSNDVEQRDIQIEELKKKINHMEHMLSDKSENEESLKQRIKSLQQPIENEVTMRAQIKELQYTVKDLTEENAGLEKMVAQKSLELDQRDTLMAQHAQVLKTKELLPLLHSKQKKDKDIIERVGAVFFEKMKTYDEECEGDSDMKQYMHDAIKSLQHNVSSLDSTVADKELSFSKDKMEEHYNLLEQKQLQVMRLQRRLQHLEMGTPKSTSSMLEAAQTYKSNGLLSMLFGGQDTPAF